MLHYLGCLWIFVGSDYFVDFEEGAVPWTLNDDDFKDMSHTDLIIYSTYWVCTVITCVGYGDYYGSTTLEYIYSFMIEFCGFVIFAVLQMAVIKIVQIDNHYSTYIAELDFQALVWFNKLEESQ